MIIYSILSIFYVLLYLFSRKQKVESDMMPKSPYKYFASMALLLYEISNRLKAYLYHQKKGNSIRHREAAVFHQIKSLTPGKNQETEKKKYYLEKISMSLFVIFVGLIVSILLSISSQNKTLIRDGAIERKGYNEGSVKVDVEIFCEDGKAEDLTVEVSDMDYTKDQIQWFYEECKPYLEESVLGDNKSLDHISEDLSFQKKIDGFPFRISWKSKDHSVIKNSGEINGNALNEEGSFVMLEATLTYQDFTFLYEFGCIVYPKSLSEKEQFALDLENALSDANQATITEDTYYLPNQVAGKEIRWQEKTKDQGKTVIWLMIGFGILIYFLKDKDLFTKTVQKKEEMLSDYPEIITKMTLLVGAGMTVRNAWKRIVLEYAAKRGTHYRYAYEEMLLTYKEMEAGISETIAYDRFGRRCEIREYVKFSALLVQNLKKGTKGLTEMLESEAENALQERRNQARIRGEKAETKLLVPMMLMLFIVLFMIMVPALSAF